MRVLVSEGPVIATPINGGGPNPLCTNAVRQEPAGPENIRMVGLALNYGDFKFASLGDADWSREMELACPVNKLGTINRLHHQPPRRARQFRRAGAPERDQRRR